MNSNPSGWPCAGTAQQKKTPTVPAKGADRGDLPVESLPYDAGSGAASGTTGAGIDTPAAQLAWHRREAALINRLLSAPGAWDPAPLVRGLQIHLDTIARLERLGVAHV
jgi:hypothetical protein